MKKLTYDGEGRGGRERVTRRGKSSSAGNNEVITVSYETFQVVSERCGYLLARNVIDAGSGKDAVIVMLQRSGRQERNKGDMAQMISSFHAQEGLECTEMVSTMDMSSPSHEGQCNMSKL